MFVKLLTSIVGSRNERLLKSMHRQVAKINALEAKISALTDEQLQAKTVEFKQKVADGTSLDSLLVEAFAVVRESAQRILGMRHFDVQLIGGMVLHQGKIAEMRTGEGKTLMSTLPAYLNALSGNSVHVITVNDYLAERDADWMRPLYDFLGLTVGTILSNQPAEDKRAAYNCDITYGTNNEFGFDYLRDNMAFSSEEKVQRELHFAIIDEVDSILIDEARTPLIISGAAEESADLYKAIDKLAPQLVRQDKEDSDGDFYVDEKTKQIYLSEQGHQRIEELLMQAGLLGEGKSLYDVTNISLMHHVNAALRANICFQKDVDYIVQNNEVVIVDEHTGRTMQGRRWSDGLHQAVEAKEGVEIQSENVTLASITFQNFFRIYNKLSGMTGTADTEAYEFQQIYALEVVVIPTNKPMVRKDMPDQIYLTAKEKYDAIINDIKQRREAGQPTLVGTASVEVSEYLSTLLNKQKISHNVLNAKMHEKEAGIIAEAGQPGAVTIATNMAGRGTDIVLGGNVEAEIAQLDDPSDAQKQQLREQWKQRHQQVLDAGGLHIIGSERHESRRIDNQLRGRAGRQGDPGSSRFYLSLDDPLMRIFASDRMGAMMQRLGLKNGESIEHRWITKAIENAQRKVEGHNFDIRKQLLEYDDVANDQRRLVYSQRAEMMAADDISEMIKTMFTQVVANVINSHISPDSLEEQWDVQGLQQQLEAEFGLAIDIQQWLDADDTRDAKALHDYVFIALEKIYQDKEQQASAEIMRQIEKSVMLQALDNHWREHLAAMDHLRQGIHLRGYAQKNPKQEYKREAFEMFNAMLDLIKHDVISILIKVQLVAEEDVDAMEAQRREAGNYKMTYQHPDSDNVESAEDVVGVAQQPVRRNEAKVGRNDSCPCGSGKKYKQCHGKI